MRLAAWWLATRRFTPDFVVAEGPRHAVPTLVPGHCPVSARRGERTDHGRFRSSRPCEVHPRDEPSTERKSEGNGSRATRRIRGAGTGTEPSKPRRLHEESICRCESRADEQATGPCSISRRCYPLAGRRDPGSVGMGGTDRSITDPTLSARPRERGRVAIRGRRVRSWPRRAREIHFVPVGITRGSAASMNT